MRRLLTALLLLPVAVLAQTPQRLSLAEAETLWQEHNRELQLARTAVSGAEADVRTAGQLPNPQLSLNLSQISPSTGYGAGPWKDKKIDNVLRVDQLIERGSKRELRVKGADARLDASRRDLDDTGRQQLLALQQTYYDLRLAQDKRRLAGDTARAATPSEVKRAMLIAFGLTALCGLPLVLFVDWKLVIVGIAAIAAGWFYTGGSRPYGYAGFGELFVFVFFGLVATVGSFYVQTLAITWLAVVSGAAMGCLATALLVVNNLRDTPGDTEVGKRTLAVRLGDANTRWLYVALMVVPFLTLPVMAGVGERPAAAAAFPYGSPRLKRLFQRVRSAAGSVPGGARFAPLPVTA